MKNVIAIVFCLAALFYVNEVHPQNNKSLDYIKSGYYQLIYEADIAYLEGDEDLAFEKLSKAEKLCPLLNQVEFQEMELYISLLMNRRKFSEAVNYIEKLATKYGALPIGIANSLYYEVTDSLLLKDLLVEYPNFEDSIFPSIITEYEKFYTEELDVLVKKLSEMLEKDQKVRSELIYAEKDPGKSKEDIESIKTEMKNIDSENLNCLYKILDQYGFPNYRLLGNKNLTLVYRCQVLFIHNSEDKNLAKRMLQYVRDGECPPSWYGFMVDRLCLEKHQKYIYAIYDNTIENEIKDIKHLDKRRLAIGMPTLAIDKKRKELQNKKD